MSDIQYFMPMYERLKPVTPWTGGRVAEVELVTLSEAAIMATMQAGETVTIGDILRASGRGEIFLKAIIHRSARLVACRAGDAVLNDGLAPEGAIPTLPLTACRALANTGRASWRTFDGLQDIGGVLHHFTKWALVEDEPDFETSLEDCRINRCEVHALADAFKPVDNTQPQAATPPAPVVEAPANSPLPVTTGDVAFAFEGLHGWNEEQWKKPLGDKPKWLDACIVIPGVRGVSETRWNPVLIGAALVRAGHAKVNIVRARFQRKPKLMPWREAWDTYEADNFDTP